MNAETEKKLKIYWDEKLSHNDKRNIVSKFKFWDGLVNYKYVYIPEDLKAILLLKIKENDKI